MRAGHQSLSDEELDQKIKEEKARLLSSKATERAIARRIVRELELEKSRRYESKFGL